MDRDTAMGTRMDGRTGMDGHAGMDIWLAGHMSLGLS